MFFANIQQVSNSSSFYRENQASDLIHLLYHNHSSFFHAGGAINNIAYEGQSPVSIFALPIDKTYLSIISFQQLIQKQLVYLTSIERENQKEQSKNGGLQFAKTLLKDLSDLFTQFFAAHYQAPKIVTNITPAEIILEITLSPQTKVFIIVLTLGDSLEFTLTYRHEKDLYRKPVTQEIILENFADLFVLYGTQHELIHGSSFFR
jgi:hypothetical protein